MALVQEVRKPKSNNPGIQIIYSVPKAGKTTLVSTLEDHLILELEQGGADYVGGRVQEITKPSEFNECLTLIKASEKQVCTYLVVNTVTKLDKK